MIISSSRLLLQRALAEAAPTPKAGIGLNISNPSTILTICPSAVEKVINPLFCQCTLNQRDKAGADRVLTTLEQIPHLLGFLRNTSCVLLTLKWIPDSEVVWHANSQGYLTVANLGTICHLWQTVKTVKDETLGKAPRYPRTPMSHDI